MSEVSLKDISALLASGKLSESDLRTLEAQLTHLERLKQRELAQTRFLKFVEKVWPTFIGGKHHARMADAFERVARGACKRLLINMPPANTKSMRWCDRRRGKVCISNSRHFARVVNTVNLPLTRASSLLFDTLAAAAEEGPRAAAGELHRTTYATAGTPTTFALMDALAAIEGRGHACRAALMPSGLAAISVPLLAYCKPGDHLLMSDSVYGPARTFASTMLTRYGVTTEFYDPHLGAGIEALIRPNTRIIYLESPGSYTFEIQDVPAICAVARAHGVLTMIDNAWASPVMARPFDRGIDISVPPPTKFWETLQAVRLVLEWTRVERRVG